MARHRTIYKQMAKPQKAQQDCKTQKMQNKLTKSYPKPHKTPPANVTHIMLNIPNHLLFEGIPLSGVQSQDVETESAECTVSFSEDRWTTKRGKRREGTIKKIKMIDNQGENQKGGHMIVSVDSSDHILKT